MNHKFLLVLFITVLFTLSCDKDPVIPPPVVEPPPIVLPPSTSGSHNYLTLDSDYIFDQEKLPTFELTISHANLSKINGDPAAEEYVEAALTFEGETLNPIGVRYKGSIGAFVNCVSGGDWSNPSGFKTCTKLSMKIKINWINSDDKFYGLKKLQLHSMNLDDSQMRDRLGYWLFREMGVPAPRAVHARLMINGEYQGLFALIEQIDGRFCKYTYDDDDGNLYKEIWPLNSQGNPFPESEYINHLKTNEEDSPSAELINNFAEEIASAQVEDYESLVKKWMDVDEIMSYIAVDRTIRNDDGAFHWYCGNGQCAPHNFYWYEEPEKQKMHLIPWDLDNAFENIITNVNPVTPIKDDWGEITNNCQIFSFGWFQTQQRSAACDPLTAAWVSFEEEYATKLDEFINGPFALQNTNAMLDQWYAQIEEATEAANLLHDDAIHPNVWSSAVNTLRNQLEHARNK